MHNQLSSLTDAGYIRQLFNNIFLFVILFATWIVLSGVFKPLLLGLGVFSCILAVYVSNRMNKDNPPINNLLIKVLKTILYSFWLTKEIVKSSISTSLKVWQLEPEISPTTADIKTKIKDDIGLTIFGNSITLTPGTVSILIKKGSVMVHSLDKDSIVDLEKGDMSRKIERITESDNKK